MKYYSGIEFGSTRIKAVVIDEGYAPISSGDYTWASRLENGVWTYDLEDALTGLKAALSGLSHRDEIAVLGISGMMHGYLAFDENWNLLTPFRTWQNTITGEAAARLTELFGFNIPQRWSIAHLYQSMLNGEAHLSRIAHITTLAGYIHYLLTGVNAVGVGEASGIFPISADGTGYDADMLAKFQTLDEARLLPRPITELLPAVLSAGADAGTLTEEGAVLLDGLLPAGVRFAPPEGDAGTGMVATNAVAPRTGNVSAGTSIFSMVVLERPLENVYEEIDLVTTPAGKPVAMVHCNNCTGDSNAWIALLKETAALFGAEPSNDEIYTKLYRKSLEGDADCGGVLTCNYLAGEGVTHFDRGRPMILRDPSATFTLSNLLRSMLYSTVATLKIGMDILAEEKVAVDSLTGHGGLFKTEGVGQRYLAAAVGAPVTCMKTAGEGGPYGMALLSAFCAEGAGQPLEEYLSNRVFAGVEGTVVTPDPTDTAGFAAYMERYKRLLQVESAAVDLF